MVGTLYEKGDDIIRSKRICMMFLLFGLLMFVLSGCNRVTKELRFGTGDAGGTYYACGSALAPYLEETAGRPVIVRMTTGSEANLRLLQSNLLDMAIVQGDTLQVSAGEFSEEARLGYSAVAAIYTEACQIIVSRSSGIMSVADLAGKRVSVGEEDSGVTHNAEQILMANGLTVDKLEVSRLSFSDAAAAMERGELDAFFCTAGAPTHAVAELAQKTDIRLIAPDRRTIDQLTGLYGYYAECVIPAGTYHGQDEDVMTLGVRAVLVADDALDAAVVSALAAALFEHRSEIQSEISVNEILDPSAAVLSVPIGFHPGAADYYQKQGITVAVSAPAESERAFRISLDMYQTLVIAVAFLCLGGFLKKRIKMLETFCIPSPVVGGLIFAVISCILYAAGVMELTFDETLKDVCMVLFFTSVGFQANLRVLKSGGVSLLIFMGCVAALIVLQNAAAVGVSALLGVDAAFGMCTGSIPMVGGHGTAGAFGPVLEGLGLEGASTLCTAAATFGLIAGSLMGGPLGHRLILKRDLLKTAVPAESGLSAKGAKSEKKDLSSVMSYAPAVYQLAIAAGAGTVVSWLLSKTGMSFPVYIGAMIVAAVMRNAGELTGKFEVHMTQINDIGAICLSLFLGIAMITLKLWQLAALAGPLIILLAVQALLMFLFARFVIYYVMGRNYDAAILAAGTCGFGMGATPNAMANMQALTERFVPSVKAYILIPIVGSMFADFINSLTITFFINLI